MSIENFASAISKDRLIEDLQAQLKAKDQEIARLKTRLSPEINSHHCCSEKAFAEETALAEWKMQQALLAGHSFTFDWDPTTDQVQRSNSCVPILGLTGEAAIHNTGQNFFQRIHPDDRDRFVQILHTLTPETANYSTEFRVRRGDGAIIVLEETGMAYFDADGKPERIFGVATDISARKQAEAELRRSEERYRLLHESLRDGFVEVTMEGRIIDCNEVYSRMLGYSAEELRLLTYIHITPECWHEKEAAIVRDQIIPQGYSDIYEKEYRQKDGTVFPVDLRTILIRDDDGQPVAMWAIVRDITERRRAEEALRLSEERYREAVELAVDGILMGSADGKIIGANSQMQKWLGSPLSQLLGLHVSELFDPEELKVKPLRFDLLNLAQPLVNERNLRRSDGTSLPVEMHSKRMPDGTYQSIYRDITERKKYQDELKSVNDELERRVELRTQELQETQSRLLHIEKLSAIGKLSASIAHEFNSPLQTVMTVLKGLRLDGQFDDGELKLLEAAIGESERMKGLIRCLQDFYRPSSGRKILMNLHATIDSLLLLHKFDLNRKNIKIELHYEERLPHIMAIPDQIKQVFLNLLNNAAEACLNQGGVISISTWREKDQVAVAIRDTGVGIQRSDMEHIFRPFFSTKANAKGTGLGLSVSYGIIKNHRGDIRFESKPGEGTTFTVMLPIDEK